jgi:hypothetical protein
MNQWAATAHKMKWAVCFPIRIFYDKKRDRWEKVPTKDMTGFLELTASVPADDPRWEKANGFGIVMRDGLYALDVDVHKDETVMANVREWFAKQGLSGQTRTHKTPSGGWHFLYQVPAKWGDLRSRVNIIYGLDGRGGREGSGGWIAFGEHYELAREKPPLTLTESACRIIEEEGQIRFGGSIIASAQVGSYAAPDNVDDIVDRLLYLVEHNHKINARWRGLSQGMEDASRSAMDMSLSWWLAAHGFERDEIAYILLNEYEKGQARYLELKYGQRAAMRCAARAMAYIEAARDDFSNWQAPPDLTLEQEAEMAGIINNGGQP